LDCEEIEAATAAVAAARHEVNLAADIVLVLEWRVRAWREVKPSVRVLAEEEEESEK